MEDHKHIEDQAAELLARRDSGEWAAPDQARLEEWLAAATAHRVAFLRLEGAWEEARRLKALAPGLPPTTVPPPHGWQTPFFTSRAERADPSSVTATPGRQRTGRSGRGWLRFSLAAAIVLGVALGAYIYLAPPGNEYRTPVGEVASVPLRDGSSITLNTATALRVDLTPKERRVALEHGEAFFVVAKDPSRPFVVEAGNRRVVAVGTQFSVRRDGSDLRVVVTEGTVRLESRAAASRGATAGERSAAAGSGPGAGSGQDAGSAAGSATPELARLTAGTIARATEGGVLVEEKSIPEAEQVLSWRDGYLTFHDTTLAEAVAEFNRYNAHQLQIGDPQVGAIRISGTFRPTNYEAFVRLLESGYSIRSKTEGEETTLAIN